MFVSKVFGASWQSFSFSNACMLITLHTYQTHTLHLKSFYAITAFDENRLCIRFITGLDKLEMLAVEQRGSNNACSCHCVEVQMNTKMRHFGIKMCVKQQPQLSKTNEAFYEIFHQMLQRMWRLQPWRHHLNDDAIELPSTLAQFSSITMYTQRSIRCSFVFYDEKG